MFKKEKLVLPENLPEGMIFEDILIPSVPNGTGIAIFSSLEDNNDFIMHIFQMLLNERDNSYYLVQQIAAISFKTHEELIAFMTQLPNMNGIDMMLFLNPLPPENTLDELLGQTQ